MRRLLYLLLLLFAAPVAAQSPDRCYPNGGQQGTTVQVTFPAMAMVESAVLVVDGDGVKAQGPFVKGVGQVEIAADARPGLRQVRLVGPKTATSPRPFMVGVLPVFLEKEPNNTGAQAQPLAQLPVTLHGALPQPQDIDVYRLSLKKGDFLVAASESRRVGAPTNLGFYLRDAAGKNVPTRLDYRRRDPLYTCLIPADGEYQVHLHEINTLGEFSDGTTYWLTLTTGPWIDYVSPPAAPAGATAALNFTGWNLGGKPGPSTLAAELPIPAEAPRDYPVSAGGAPNLAVVQVTATPDIPEAEPNNAPASAQPLALPASISGTFGARGDVDVFQVTARAKEVLTLTVEARELESYADPVLKILDPSGKMLQSEDDQNASRDPSLTWTAPADGVYSIVLKDVASGSRGGPSFFYRLRVAAGVSDLRLKAKDPTYIVKPGAKVEVVVTVSQSYQPDEVTLRVEGLPPGVTAAPVTVPASPKRENTTQAKIVLTAAPDAAPGFGAVRVIATTSGATPLSSAATWMITGDGGWGYGTGSTDRLIVLVPTP